MLQYIKSSHIYLHSATVLIASMQLYESKQENSSSIMQEEINMSFFQLKSVNWWFSVVHPVQLSSNGVCVICHASPNKQAKGNSGKDPKLEIE